MTAEQRWVSGKSMKWAPGLARKLVVLGLKEATMCGLILRVIRKEGVGKEGLSFKEISLAAIVEMDGRDLD